MTAHVRRPLVDPAAADHLVVRLQGRSGWYQGVAELRDPTGVPAWTIPLGPVPRDCSAVVDALALSVAIRVNPRGKSAKAPALTPNAHRPFGVDGEVLPMASQIRRISSPDTVAPASIEAEPEYRVRLGVNGGVALAAGPGWAPSFALDAGVRWRDRPLPSPSRAASSRRRAATSPVARIGSTSRPTASPGRPSRAVSLSASCSPAASPRRARFMGQARR